MMRKTAGGILVLLLALGMAGCAGPDVDRTAAGFDYEDYYADLNNCRGGGAIGAALETTGIGLWGGLVGAYHGLYLGVTASEKAEGMMFGAIVGAGAGIGIGAVNSIREYNSYITDCLRAKGYSLS